MSRPILAGYDPETADRAPVEFAAAAARFTGAPLIVCAVSGRHDAATGEIDHDLGGDASGALARIEQELETEGIAVEYRELSGTSAAGALHRAAEEHDAGLLVVGSTRRGTVGRVLPGSTADRLMHGAPCPIAVVPAGWAGRGELKAIGVAYVDTEEGREALRGAHALARAAGAKLRAITAVQVNPAWFGETEAGTPVRPPKHMEEVEGEHRLAAEAALRRQVAELGDDVPVEADAFIGDPAEALVTVSEHLDLLVLGSRGYGPLRAVLLGGVSRQVAAQAHCPVIVLPRGVKAPLEQLFTAPRGAGAAGGIP
jgi:nucleotide-binding universal stress UspA family protein